MRKHIKKTGSVLDDCPIVEPRSEPRSQKQTNLQEQKSPFTGNIDLFIRELKEDLPQNWVKRFDFSNLIKSTENPNRWFVTVKDKIFREGDTVWAYWEYPEWCSVSALLEFGKLFNGSKKYKFASNYHCHIVDFWDCYCELTCGEITIDFYWLQF